MVNDKVQYMVHYMVHTWCITQCIPWCIAHPVAAVAHEAQVGDGTLGGAELAFAQRELVGEGDHELAVTVGGGGGGADSLHCERGAVVRWRW